MYDDCILRCKSNAYDYRWFEMLHVFVCERWFTAVLFFLIKKGHQQNYLPARVELVNVLLVQYKTQLKKRVEQIWMQIRHGRLDLKKIVLCLLGIVSEILYVFGAARIQQLDKSVEFVHLIKDFLISHFLLLFLLKL